MVKRARDEDEALARSRAAAAAADPEQEICLGGDGPLVFDVPGSKPSDLILTYFAIKGLGEVPRLLLAEADVAYISVAVQGGEPPDVVGDWRAKSPNGLLPIATGLGVPRSSPISQSSSIIRFLARHFKLDGGDDEAGKVRADVLFETAKDLGAKASEVVEATGAGDAETAAAKEAAVAKGPFALALRLEALVAPDPHRIHCYRDDETPVTYGHLQLFRELAKIEAKGGDLSRLSLALAAFKEHVANRKRIKAYLASPLCFPDTFGEIGQEGGYAYASGPKKRSEFAL